MKRILVLTALILVLYCTAGCKAQIPSNPTTYTCPVSTGTAYTPLNQASPATGLAYTDTKPAAGQYCYIAQSVNGSQTSVPSNTAGPLTTSGSNSVDLTWIAPTSGTTPTGYVISRASAVASTILAPALGTNPTIAAGVYPLGYIQDPAGSSFQLVGQVR